jgi:hypothetical protein
VHFFPARSNVCLVCRWLVLIWPPWHVHSGAGRERQWQVGLKIKFFFAIEI